MYVIPTPGLSIRDPDLMDLLPEAGRLVPASDYWLHRVRDNDVALGQPPAAAEEAPAQPFDHEGSAQ